MVTLYQESKTMSNITVEHIQQARKEFPKATCLHNSYTVQDIKDNICSSFSGEEDNQFYRGKGLIVVLRSPDNHSEFLVIFSGIAEDFQVIGYLFSISEDNFRRSLN
jgi:hypothetical protein